MNFFCLLVSYLKSRKFFYRQLLIAAILVAAENSKFAKPAQAQSTLACNNIYVSVLNGSPTNTYPTGKEIHQLDWSNGTFVTTLSTSISGVTGGIGIDPNSKKIYYIDGNGGSGYSGTYSGTAYSSKGRIYSFDGSTSSSILNIIADPTTEHLAGMDLSGVLWTTKWNTTKDLYSYNPTTNTVSGNQGTITASSNSTEWNALAEGDFAFDKNDLMWYVSTYNSQVAIWTVNRSTRVATRVGNYGSITGTNHVVTGGAFGPDGKLYIGTSLGAIYKFDTDLKTLTLVNNTGKTITDMTSCMYPSISISGNVWHDQDNSAQNTFTNIKTGSETGTNGGGLNAFLLDANNKVIASSAVASNGSYSFPSISSNQSALKIRLSTATATVGSTAPTASLPSGWRGTSPLEITSLNTGTTNITNQDFGIHPLDYGDAPDTGVAPATAKDNYQTISGDSGPSHGIVTGIALGTNIDADSGTLQNANADADDTNPSGNPNDEDGVKLGSSSLQNQTLFLGNNVTLNIATQGSGKLSGWIDWNQDGDFLDPGEKIATDVTPTSNAISLPITVPTTATTGTTYARFRYSTQTGLASTGAASDGEIEDYKIAIAGTDYGDAPDSYGTNSTNNNSEGVGANHVIVNTLNLGANAPDAETDAPTTLTGTQDDTTGTDDEDGIATPFPVLNTTTNTYSLTATVNNTTGSAANVFAWIDFDRDGKFDGDERATVTSGSVNLVSGKVPTGTTNKTVTLTWSNIGGTGANIVSGASYVRIRLTTDNLSNTGSPTTARDTVSVGNASNGEVEDYPLAIAQARDYGDAPDATSGTSTGNYQTTLADGGASQAVINASGQVLKLGSNIDSDDGSLQDLNAQADDSNGTDDEDGVNSFPFLTTTAGQTYVVPVTVSNNVSAAYLVGYIDFNKDGDFNDNGERSVIDLNNDGDFNDNGEQSANVSIPSSTTNSRIFNVTFSTPTGITTGSTYARFRLSQSTTTAGLPTGASADTDYGEVEDYQIAIAPAPPVPTSVTSTCTAPETLVSPSAFTLNSSNYSLDTALQNSVPSLLPLSLYNGTMRFNATLSTNANWADGVRLRNDATFGNHLFLQPKDTNAYLTTNGKKATYEFSFPSGVKNFSTVVGGLNNYDGTTIVASYQGNTVPISAANFSNLSTGMTLSDTNVDTDNQVDTVVSTNTTGTTEVTNNFYTLTIPNLIDKITVYSGKEHDSDSTATIGFSLIGYCADFDYGDAPDTYGTDKTANNSSSSGTDPVGARHGIVSKLKLGTNAPDAETDAQTPLNGTGDSTDEDGITTFPSLNTNYSSYTLSATVANTTGNAANVYAWIDFDGDGKFDGDERATVNNGTGTNGITLQSGQVPTGASGTVTLTWDSLGGTGANIVNGNTYARIRLTTDPLGAATATNTRDNASVTTASDGEVEDYPIAIAPVDYGDAPDTYGTDKTSSSSTDPVGASHVIVNTLKLGNNEPDAENNAQTPLDGTGDDNSGTPDDEDGITTPFPFLGTFTNTYRLTARVNNTTGSDANVYAWIDFDRDGKFDGDERATVSNGSITLSGGKVPTANNGTVTLTWSSIGNAGANIVDGASYARIRLTTDNLSNTTTPTNDRDTASVGNATNGEVEDYKVEIIKSTNNPDLPPDFCQASTSRNLLFILDDSSSVTSPTEVQQQRDAVMATLNSFVAKGLAGQAAIVGFDTIGRLVINYTAITAANLASFQTALNTKYGVDGSGTNWEAGFQAGINLGATQPNTVFFFTDGVQNTGGTPEDEAQQFKNAGAHIYGIGVEDYASPIDSININSGFKPITDGENSVTYNGSNILEADYVDINSFDALQSQYTNNFLANLCPADFSDAPDTYGTDNVVSATEPLGANHAVTPGLFLGTTPADQDANGFVDGTDNSSGNAADDDAVSGAGTGNGNDEGSFTFPTLDTGKKVYQIPAANITVTNTTTQSATLHAWIDFDKNGKFDPTEYTSILVPQGTNNGNLTANLTWSGINVGATGSTYARFRLTSDTSINNATPGGAASSGEVEDYQIAIATASDPNLLLVKRITAINPGKPDEILFNNFVDDSGTTNDTDPLWPDPNVYLRGAIDAGEVKPGDEVEYTVYFLSSGKENAKQVQICDVVPDQMTFVKNTYGVELGIGLGLNSAALPTAPNLKLSNLLNDDQGDFFGPGTTPPANLCKKVSPSNTSVNVNGTNNDNGAVVVKIQDLPKANNPGSPMDSYGFIRFRAKVK